MDFQFSLNGEIDPIAAYAAMLSSALGIWELVKWRHRHAVRLSVNPNMLFIPSSDKNKYIVASVTNLGETATTITHYLAYHWPSRWHKLVKKGQTSFIVNSDKVPHVLQPGEQWMGQALQDEEMEGLGSTGILEMGIIHSMSKKEILQRVKIIPKAEKSK